jgi:apolipoprotein N-acyltransferase
MMNYKNLRWLLPVLSGLFLLFGYPPYSLVLLPFFGLLPLLIFLRLKNSLKESFLGGFISGIIFLGGTLVWLFGALPLDWLGIKSIFWAFLILSIIWILLILVLSLFVGLFSLSCVYLRRKGFWDILLIPSLWIVFEYLRAFVFGILYYGEGSLLGPHWTFGNLAYILAQSQGFMFLASIGGIYLLSFIVVFFNVLLFILTRRPKKNKIILLFIVFTIIFVGYFVPIARSSGERAGEVFNVAVLQTDFPSLYRENREILEEKFKTQRDLLREAFFVNPDLDLVVFPEGSDFLSEEKAEELIAVSSEKDFLIIDSSKRKMRDGSRFVATLYDGRGVKLATYEKILLVPVGDYLPYLFKLPAQVFNEKWTKEAESREYQKGENLTLLSDGDSFHGGLLFCAEVVSPILYRQAVRDGAEIFLNVGSLGFANGSQMLISQTQAMLQLRAAENGRYLARATNFGYSYIINQNGAIIQNTQDFEKQVLFGEVVSKKRETPYTRYGDWILVVSSLSVLTFFTIYHIIGRKRNW